MTNVRRNQAPQPTHRPHTPNIVRPPPPRLPVADTFDGVAALQEGASVDGIFLGATGKSLPASTPLGAVPGVKPNNGATVQRRAVFVNGILTPVEAHRRDMQALANTGLEVVGLHNATNGPLRDVSQAGVDKIGSTKNPAVRALRDLVLSSVRNGKPLMLVGHSQGALVISRALSDAKALLLERARPGQSAASRLTEVERQLSNIEVETFGGAASRYPDGPQYTHYVNRLDLVPLTTGVGARRLKPFDQPGRGAKVVYLTRFDRHSIGSLGGTHSASGVYFSARTRTASHR